MTASMRSKCPKIDLFVLCFEQGKFDATIQDIITCYQELTGKNKKLWNNMVAVITKVQYSEEEHGTFEAWESEMIKWSSSLKKEFSRRYQMNDISILVISQDLSRKKRKENQQGTQQNDLMMAEMQKIYQKSISNLNDGDLDDQEEQKL